MFPTRHPITSVGLYVRFGESGVQVELRGSNRQHSTVFSMHLSAVDAVRDFEARCSALSAENPDMTYRQVEDVVLVRWWTDLEATGVAVEVIR